MINIKRKISKKSKKLKLKTLSILKKKGNYDKLGTHEKYDNFYRDAKDNRIFHSKEVSGKNAHAGEHWKRFIQRGNKLYHEANIDMNGNVMKSNKGKVGRIIDMNDLIGVHK